MSVSTGSSRVEAETKDLEAGESQPLVVIETSGKLISQATEDIRRGFASKVFTLVSMQFMFAAVYSCFPYASEEVFDSVKPYAKVSAGVGGFLVLIMSLMRCCTSIERKYPYNYVFMVGYTVSLATILQFVAMALIPHPKFVALAGIFACVVSITLTLALIAKFSSIDFTGWLPYLLVLALAMAIGGALVSYGTTNMIWYGVAAVVMVVFYMLAILQAIMKGDKKYSYEVDDYVTAANDLYVLMVRLVLELIKFYARSPYALAR